MVLLALARERGRRSFQEISEVLREMAPKPLQGGPKKMGRMGNMNVARDLSRIEGGKYYYYDCISACASAKNDRGKALQILRG